LGFARDAKDFSPHLTIGRIRDERDRSARALATALVQAGVAGEPFRVGEVVLMRSILAPAGARYTPLARIPLLDT
jgi:2'-5' RNA ligase